MRFELNNGEESEYFEDTKTGHTYWFNEHEDFCNVCELLNEITTENTTKKEDTTFKKDLKNSMMSRIEKNNKKIEILDKAVEDNEDNIPILLSSSILKSQNDCLYSLMKEFNL